VTGMSLLSSLPTYWNPAGRFAVGATVFLPTFAVLALAKSAPGKLSDQVETTRAQRIAYALHAAYFVSCVLTFEVAIDSPPMAATGAPPPKPDNLFWQMTCLSGEVFFVATTALACMACQTQVPRWSLLVPLAQTAYNLKNTLIWCFLYSTFSPVGKPIALMYADGVMIAMLTAIYLHHFFTARAVKKEK